MRIPADFRPLVPLYVTMFLEAVGSGLVASIISVVARNDLGCTGTQIGIVFTGYNVAQVFGSIASGYLSDRVRRKYVLMLSLTWAAIGYIITAFSTSFHWFLVSRVFTGLCGGFSSVAIAILTANLPMERLPMAIGRLGTVTSMGFAIGPLISLGISAIWGTGETVRQAYFFVAAVVYLFACFLASRITRQITPSDSRFMRESSGGNLSASLIFVWMSRYFATCGQTAIYVTQVLLWQDYFGLDRMYVILMTTASGVIVSIAQGLMFPFLVGRIGFHAALTLGIFLIALASCAIAALAATGSFPVHFLCLVLFWLGIGCMEPGTSVAVTRHLGIGKKNPTIHTGLAMGVTSAMKYLASLSVPALAGYLYDQYGARLYFVGSGFSAIGLSSVAIAWFLFDDRSEEISTSKSTTDISIPNDV